MTHRGAQLAAAQGQGRRARLGLRDGGVAEESEDSKADERFLRMLRRAS